MDRVVASFVEMVQIDSESGDEAAFLSYLSERLARDLGADCTFDGYGNLIARVPGKRTRTDRPILFGVHGDTVKPGRGIRPTIEDGVIRSAGETILGADDKAGIAELVEAALTADRRPPLEIVVTREEELGARGARHLDVSSLQSRIGFIVDMDALDAVVIGGPSKMSIDVEITGRAAHAAIEPEKGISAVRVAAYAIVELEEGRVGEGTTVNVGVVRGGEIRNGVPEKALAQLECRSLSHEVCLEQERHIREVFQRAASSHGAVVSFSTELSYRASRVPDGSPAIALAAAAIESVGLTPDLRTIVGGTDASILNERGIETVVLGAGMRNEHSTNEEIDVASMERAVGILRHLLEHSDSPRRRARASSGDSALRYTNNGC